MIPRFSITAGGITADSSSLTDSGLPVSVRVDLRLNQINTAVIRMGLVPKGSVAVGDPVKIEMGNEANGTETVFTGIVSELRQETMAYTIWCSSALATLTHLRVNKVYAQQKAGDIVRDIASIAEVSTGSVETGLDYPVYALGADRHLLAHLHNLARRDGFDLYADADDTLVYAAYAPGPGLSQKLRYGAEILAYHSETHAARADGVEVYGESPASLGEGDKAYSWLTKEEVKGNAGNSSGNVLRIADPSIRNQDAAGTAAEKILAELSTEMSGWTEALGTPKPKLGAAIKLADLPQNGPNGTFKITAVRHHFDKQRGYTTIIYWKEE
ncbi:MAG TPA: hypothetical protein ENJ82_13010 [Bacteroidetes bacterium]|nr:hypothetical protein [Bacteroidota bacterium]